MPVVISGENVEVVNQYKYLGTVLDSRLTFEAHVDSLCKKAHQRMYFYQKLRGFNVDSTFMKMFYSCFYWVCSFNFICWFGFLNVKNRTKLLGIVKLCRKIAGTALSNLTDLQKVRSAKKARLILADSDHPPHQEFLWTQISGAYM